MPELPEVECFRRVLLPLINPKAPLYLELVGANPSRKFISPEQVTEINNASLCVLEIKRRGKQICLYLGMPNGSPSKFLFVHMGMTGRITAPGKAPQFGHFSNIAVEENELRPKSGSDYPPPYTYLTFRAGDAQASFSDPRKFGSTYLADSDSELHQLAPDALEEEFDLLALCNKSLGVKALLLDQKRVVSGVGNWVADEILYQTEIHPLQTHLTESQASNIQKTLPKLLQTAVECLDQCTNYPGHWLFHFRWTKGKNAGAKDALGRSLQFLTAGGRTSAIVPTVQKLRKSQEKQEKTVVIKKVQRKPQIIVSSDVLPAKRKKATEQPEVERSKLRVKLEAKNGEASKVKPCATRRRSPRITTVKTAM